MTVKSGAVSVYNDRAAAALAPISIFNKLLAKLLIAEFVLVYYILTCTGTTREEKYDERHRSEHHQNQSVL